MAGGGPPRGGIEPEGLASCGVAGTLGRGTRGSGRGRGGVVGYHQPFPRQTRVFVGAGSVSPGALARSARRRCRILGSGFFFLRCHPRIRVTPVRPPLIACGQWAAIRQRSEVNLRHQLPFETRLQPSATTKKASLKGLAPRLAWRDNHHAPSTSASRRRRRGR